MNPLPFPYVFVVKILLPSLSCAVETLGTQARGTTAGRPWCFSLLACQSGVPLSLPIPIPFFVYLACTW